MFTSDSLSIKASNHIKDKFKVYVTTSVSFVDGVMSIEIFDKVFEVCSLTFEDFVIAGRSVVAKVNKWIRGNFDLIQESPEVIEEEPVYFEDEVEPSCGCLSKTGTIYNHPELRAWQKHSIKYDPTYSGIILGMPGESQDFYVDMSLLKQYRRQCNAWAHPDKGGDSEMFDMITAAYERLTVMIHKAGGRL